MPGGVPAHSHPEYWTEREHERYEDRVAAEIKGLRDDVRLLTVRVTMLFGGLAAIGALVTMLPVLAPAIRAIFGVPPP